MPIDQLILNSGFRRWSRGTPMIDDSNRLQRALNGAMTADRWYGVADEGTAQVIEPSYKDGMGFGNHGAYQMKWLVPGRKAGIIQIIQHELSANARREGLGNNMTLAVEPIASVPGVVMKMALLAWYVPNTCDQGPRQPIASWNAFGTDPTLVNGYTYALGPMAVNVDNINLVRQKLDGFVSGQSYNLSVFFWADTPPSNVGDLLTFVRASLKPGLNNADYEEWPSLIEDWAMEGYDRYSYTLVDYPGRAIRTNCLLRVAPSQNGALWVDAPMKGFWQKVPPMVWIIDPDSEGNPSLGFARNTGVNGSKDIKVPVTVTNAGVNGFAIRGTWDAGDEILFHYRLMREMGT